MKVVVAPQEFKGTLTAARAARAMAFAVRRILPGMELALRPMADGGPGTLAALLASRGGHRRRRRVTGPNGGRVTAAWGVLPDGTAVIEMAQAAGLLQIRGPQRPMTATTRGVGELILAALDAGSRHVLVGLGGSATSDGGTGMARALGVRFLDAGGKELPEGGGALDSLAEVDLSPLDRRVHAASFVALCDVDNPLFGERGAARVFGPQKGATAAQVEQLERGFARLAALTPGGSVAATRPGAGAAGGLGFGLAAFCAASLERGAAAVAGAIGLDAALEGAALCLTGEGQLDAQTAGGKAPLEVAERAARLGVPVIAVAGRLGPGWEALRRRFAGLAAVLDTPAVAGLGAAQAARITTETALQAWLAGRADGD